MQRAGSLEQNVLCQSQARLAAALLPIKWHDIPLIGPNCCRQCDHRTECPAAWREFTAPAVMYNRLQKPPETFIIF